MIGIIIKVLADMVTELAGKDTLTQIYEQAGVEPTKVFSLHEAYDDEEWQRIFKATLKVMSLSEKAAYEAYADAFITYVEAMFPTWFNMANNTREFLLLQPTIHNSFASSVPKSEDRQLVKDKFKIKTSAGSSALTVFYQSPNKHCGLYIALAKKLACRFGDEIRATEQSCMLKGDNMCQIDIEFIQLCMESNE